MPLDEIAKYEVMQGAELNAAKERLAYEVTALIHGKDEADKALAAAKALFAGGVGGGNMPETEFCADDLTDGGINILDAMIKAGLIPSKGEGRRLITQGGVSVDDVKITDIAHMITAEQLTEGVIVKKGKKTFHKITLK